MKTENLYDTESNLCAALNSVRQATANIPEGMEEIRDDLKWVEESLEAAIHEQKTEGELSFVPTRLGGIGA